MEVDEKDELKDVVEEKAPRGGAAGAAVGAGAIVDVEPDEWADDLPTVRRKPGQAKDKSKDKSNAKGSAGKGKYKDKGNPPRLSLQEQRAALRGRADLQELLDGLSVSHGQGAVDAALDALLLSLEPPER